MEQEDYNKHRLGEIGNLIRNYRINEGMSRQDLSEVSGVHENTIARMESGGNTTLLNLVVIADGLGIDIGDLLIAD